MSVLVVYYVLTLLFVTTETPLVLSPATKAVVLV